jgi:hypothetical protein
MCTDNSYQIKYGDFTFRTINSYRVARLTVAKQSLNLKLSYLRYLLNMFHVVQNQLNGYIIALTDVLEYITISITFDVYDEPTEKHPTLVNYRQL